VIRGRARSRAARVAAAALACVALTGWGAVHAAVRSPGQTIVAVVDASPRGVGRGPLTWLEGLAGGLSARDRLAVVTYGRGVQVAVPPTLLAHGGRAALVAGLPRLNRSGRTSLRRALTWVAQRLLRRWPSVGRIVVLAAAGATAPPRVGGVPLTVLRAQPGVNPYVAAARAVAAADGGWAVPASVAQAAVPAGVARVAAFGPDVHWRGEGAVGAALQLSALPAGPWPLIHAAALVLPAAPPLGGLRVRPAAGATGLRSELPVPVSVRWRSATGWKSVRLPPFGTRTVPARLSAAALLTRPRTRVWVAARPGPTSSRSAQTGRRSGLGVPLRSTLPWRAAGLGIAGAALAILALMWRRRYRETGLSLEVRPAGREGDAGARLPLRGDRVALDARLASRVGSRHDGSLASCVADDAGAWELRAEGVHHVYGADGLPRRAVRLEPYRWTRLADLEVRLVDKKGQGDRLPAGGRAS
jgi:hypothetical protein